MAFSVMLRKLCVKSTKFIINKTVLLNVNLSAG